MSRRPFAKRSQSSRSCYTVLAALGQGSGAFTVDIADVDPSASEYRGANGRPDTNKVQEAAVKLLGEKMSPEALKNYDAVIFNCTTGDLPIPDMDAFLNWIRSGKGFVGIHAATDTFRNHTPPHAYIQMIGGEFKQHGPQVEVDVINQDPVFPSTKHYPPTFKVYDEIYQMQNFDRSKVHGLLTLDKHPNDKTPGDYPVSWCKLFGQGRVFYTSLGHREDVWDPTWKDPRARTAADERKDDPKVAQDFQKQLLGGINWALGLQPADATPQRVQ